MMENREKKESLRPSRVHRHTLCVLTSLAVFTFGSVMLTQASGTGSAGEGWQDQKTEQTEENKQGDQKVEGGLNEETDDLGNEPGSTKIHGSLGSLKTSDDEDGDGLVGVDIDEDGAMDIYINVKDIIEVKVPLQMNITAKWNGRVNPEKPLVLSSIGIIENMNPAGQLKAELVGFEKSAQYTDNENAASDLNLTSSPAGEDDINILAQAETEENPKESNAFAQDGAEMLNQGSVAGRSENTPLPMGTLDKAGEALSKGAFCFTADYKKEFTVKYETVTKTKPIVYTAVYRFTPVD